jgi:hypothetical protein
MSETRSLVSFGPIANRAGSAGKPGDIFSFLQIQRTPIASKPASMLVLRVVQGNPPPAAASRNRVAAIEA